MAESSFLKDMGKAIGELFTFGKLAQEQEMPIEVTFALIGYLAKADRIITSHEAEFINNLVDELDLPTQGRALADAAFERGVARQIDVRHEARRYLAKFPPGSVEVNRLLDTLLRLSASDGRLFPRERAALVEIADALHFTETQLDARLQGIVKP